MRCRGRRCLFPDSSSIQSSSRRPLHLTMLLLAAVAGPRLAAAATTQPRSLLPHRGAFLLHTSSRATSSTARRRLTTAATASTAPLAATDKDREVFDIPPFEATPATEKDLQSIEERQLCHQVTCAGGPRQRCKHGFPQAFVFHPSKTSFNSGLFRLTCPLLVKAVDEYEAQGGLREFNDMMQRDPSMQHEFRRVNARHSAIRRQLAAPEELEPYIEKLGPQAVEQIMASGIAGVSPTKTEDLKCLHAHLADYLCTRDNNVGKRVYDFLQDKRSIEVDGCSTCWQQCDVSHERTPESWWYTPTKNKQKLRSRYERRHKRKAEAARQKQGQGQEEVEGETGIMGGDGDVGTER